MTFVYPTFLWAFLVLLLPIIVHLFNFRRYKTVYFSRVKFLQEVVEDSKSGNQLKHLLVLFSRLLFLSCLILAFAQPFIPSKSGEKTKNLTSIYIDNSFSLQAEGSDGNLLNELKNQAIDLVQTLDKDEKVNILTGDLLSLHQRFYSKSEAIEIIKEIGFSARSTALEDVIRLQADLFKNSFENANQRLFIFSDFQASTNSLENLNLSEIQTYYYQAKPAIEENIFIDTVWFESPVHRVKTPVDVHFRIRNNSESPVENLSVRLKINGNEPSPKRVSIAANSFIEDQITFTDRTSGIKTGEISIQTGQLFFDDHFYFTYTIKEVVNILVVQEEKTRSKNLEQLYSLDEYYQTTISSINNVKPELIEENELIILNGINKIPNGIKGLLNQKLENGGTVVLVPGTATDRTNWNDFLSNHKLPTINGLDTNDLQLRYFNDEDPLYTGVFTSKPNNFKNPITFKHYQLSLTGLQDYITLFGATPTSPYLLYKSENSGRIVFAASPFISDFTNLQNHALFAATFLRLAETATFRKPLFTTIGAMDNFPVYHELTEQKPIHLINEKEKVDVIPEVISKGKVQMISFNHLEDAINTAGFYKLTDHGTFNEIIGVNYNRIESNINSLKGPELLDNFQSIGWTNASELKISGSGSVQINQIKAQEYWRILLILALVFIGIEILLLKFWKG